MRARAFSHPCVSVRTCMIHVCASTACILFTSISSCTQSLCRECRAGCGGPCPRYNAMKALHPQHLPPPPHTHTPSPSQPIACCIDFLGRKQQFLADKDTSSVRKASRVNCRPSTHRTWPTQDEGLEGCLPFVCRSLANIKMGNRPRVCFFVRGGWVERGGGGGGGQLCTRMRGRGKG